MSRILVDSGIDWIGKIPETWTIQPLGLYLKERNEKVSDIDYKPLSVTKNGIVPQLENAAKSDAHDARKRVCKNDFVINSRSDRKQSCGLSNLDGSVSLINTVLQIKEYVPNYVKYMLDNTMFAEEFYRNGHGIVADLWTTKYSEMKNIYIPEPSKEEQTKIADYLDDKCSKVDQTIDDNNKAIELLEELKNNTILDYVLGNKYRNRKKTSIEWIKDIPETWNVTNIGLNCFVTKLAGFEYTNYFDGNITSNGDVPIVRAQNIKMGIFKDDIEEYISMNISLKLSRCALDKRCVLITFIGAGIGEVALFEKNERYHLAPNVAKIVVNPDKKNIIDEKYLMYYLMSNAGQEEINQIKKATAQPSLSMETIRNIKIVVPDTLDEQLEIVSHLDKMCFNIDRVIEYRKQIIEKLEEYKKSLIYEVVTGKKEV